MAQTLTEGGQRAKQIADGVVEFLDAARERLDIALYDVRLPGPVGDRVADALRAAAARGVRMRLAYNVDSAKPIPVPPPPRTRPELIETLPFPTRDIPGIPDLMHHKYVVRDGEAVWCGSTNWTLDSWEREENVILTVASAGIADAYERNFEELWERRSVERYRPGSVHDYMHAKVTVADGTVFAGSFNLSRSGERNAEAILEIADPALADRLASFVDEIRARYPDEVSPRRRGRPARSRPPAPDRR